jgi:hypothetical protein
MFGAERQQGQVSKRLKYSTKPTICARPEAALFPCRPWPVSPSSRCLAAEYAMIPDKLRRSAI